jgi:hypothetical protein
MSPIALFPQAGISSRRMSFSTSCPLRLSLTARVMNSSITTENSWLRRPCSGSMAEPASYLALARPVDRVAAKTTVHQPGLSGSFTGLLTRRSWQPFLRIIRCVNRRFRQRRPRAIAIDEPFNPRRQWLWRKRPMSRSGRKTVSVAWQKQPRKAVWGQRGLQSRRPAPERVHLPDCDSDHATKKLSPIKFHTRIHGAQVFHRKSFGRPISPSFVRSSC